MLGPLLTLDSLAKHCKIDLVTKIHIVLRYYSGEVSGHLAREWGCKRLQLQRGSSVFHATSNTLELNLCYSSWFSRMKYEEIIFSFVRARN